MRNGLGNNFDQPFSVPLGAWNPSLLSSLSFWVRPDAGVFEDAGSDPAEQTDPVYQQNDYSSGGRNAVQTTIGKRPTLDTVSSQPMLTYVAASSQELALSSDLTVGANSAGWCIYCVCSRSSNAQTIAPLGLSSADRVVMLFGTTAYLIVGAFVTASGVNGSGLMLLKWSRAAAAGGGLVTFQATGYAATSMGWSGTDVGPFTVNRIGARPAASQYTNGSLSHIIVTNTDISGTADETKLLAYLAAQTGAAL